MKKVYTENGYNIEATIEGKGIDAIAHIKYNGIDIGTLVKGLMYRSERFVWVPKQEEHGAGVLHYQNIWEASKDLWKLYKKENM